MQDTLMTCADVQRLLHEAQNPEAQLSVEAETHLARCVQCRTVRQDLAALRGALQQMPLPGLPDGFELSLRRQLTRTAPGRQDHRASHRGRALAAAGAALAAAVLLVAGLTLWHRQQPSAPPAALAFHRLHLSIVSPQAHSQATVEVILPAGVRAEPSVVSALGGGETLRWQSELGAGTNEIDLPLVAQPGRSGVVQVRLLVAGRSLTSTVPLAAAVPATEVKLALAPGDRMVAWQ